MHSYKTIFVHVDDSAAPESRCTLAATDHLGAGRVVADDKRYTLLSQRRQTDLVVVSHDSRNSADIAIGSSAASRASRWNVPPCP